MTRVRHRATLGSLRLLLLIALVVTLGVAVVLFVGWRLAAPVQTQIGRPPEDPSGEDVAFPSASGAVVHGWFATAPDPKGVVILLPGVRANRLSMVDRARFLRKAGYAVLLIDLQATGETVGRQITFGWLESHDVRAAAEFARKKAPALPVILLGTSLGGAAALLAAPRVEVDAMILEAVYPTVEKATANRLRMRFGRIGELAAPLLLLQLRRRVGVSPDKLRPVDHIAKIDCPVFLIGGSEDRHTTPADMRMMFAKAREPKQLWLVQRAAHVDFHRARPDEYERRVLSFLARFVCRSAS